LEYGTYGFSNQKKLQLSEDEIKILQIEANQDKSIAQHFFSLQALSVLA
jgi:hypothetical protein